MVNVPILKTIAKRIVGKLVTIKSVTDDNDLMIINKSGITIRLKVADVRIIRRTP